MDAEDRHERMQRIGLSLERFIAADTWNETLNTLIAEQDNLLTDDAESLLGQFSDEARIKQQSHLADFLELHLLIIQSVRQGGVEAARRLLDAIFQGHIDGD